MTGSPPPSAEPVWTKLVADLGSAFPPSFILFSTAYSLLSDAIRSYNANAVAAAAAMSRATTEAACYIFLTRSKGPLHGAPGALVWRINYPKNLSRKPRDVYWREIREALSSSSALGEGDYQQIGRIQANGNLAVHAAARQDRELHRLEVISRAAEEGRKVSTEQLKPLHLWVTKEEAYRDIEAASNILKKLVLAADKWT